MSKSGEFQGLPSWVSGTASWAFAWLGDSQQRGRLWINEAQSKALQGEAKNKPSKP